jgi:hypothetical protein
MQQIFSAMAALRSAMAETHTTLWVPLPDTMSASRPTQIIE